MMTLVQQKKEAWTKVAEAFSKSAAGDRSQRHTSGLTWSGLCWAARVVAGYGSALHMAMYQDLREIAVTADLHGWWWPAFGDDGFRAKRDHGERAILATLLAESAED